MNFSILHPPVISPKKQLFLLSYFLTYCWSEVIDKNLIPQITIMSAQNHLIRIALVKSIFLTVSLHW